MFRKYLSHVCLGFTLTLISIATIVHASIQNTPARVGLDSTIYLPIITAAPPMADEAILILEPGTTSRLTSPLHLAGIANPTFEQNLGVRIILLDGSVLTTTFATIQADLGERGPFSVDIPFTVSGEQQAIIQVYSDSARDGGITHLSSVFVTLAASGPANIQPGEDPHERLLILNPAFNETISGGTVHVEGYGLASFEQHLLVEVLDEDGTVIGSAPVIVNAPDMGLPGPFTVDIPYTLTTGGAGRIVVHDPSPAFVGDVHVTSVEVHLEP